MIRTTSALATAAGILASASALAQEPPFPTVSTDIPTNVFYILDDSASDENQNMFFAAQPSVTIEWWNGVFLNGVLNITNSPPAGDDSFFEYEDINIDSLNLFVTDWVWSAQVGKTSLPFGLAPVDAPGLFGTNLVTDYTYDGLIAAMGGYDVGHPLFDGTMGTHNLIVSAFFVDTTFMSATAFGEVDQATLADGGPANTENFESWLLTYDATGVPFIPGGVDYRLSWIKNAAGVGDTADEEGYSIGVSFTLPVAGRDTLSSASGEYVAITPVLEYAQIDNFGGTSGVDQDFWTAGFEVVMGQWFASGTTTLLYVDDPVNGDDDNQLFTASAGYQFNEAALVQLGYAFEDVANVDSHYVGFQVSYDFQPNDYTSFWPTFGQRARVLSNTQLEQNYRR